MQKELVRLERNTGTWRYQQPTKLIQSNITASTILQSEPGNSQLKKIDASMRGRFK